MDLTRDDVLHVAKLARIRLTEADVEKFQEQLSAILGHFRELEALDTSEIPPTSHPLPLESVMRDDAVRASLSQEAALANAPLAEDGSFRVRAVLEE
jgi:aspartyl-tRNA(Asn)/glutamyl-tRNA(Gln) amidotransferase subunit C